MSEILVLGDASQASFTQNYLAAANIDLFATGGNEFTLDALAFQPIDNGGGGYDLWINGVLAGSVNIESTRSIARISGLDYPVRHGKFTLSLRPRVGSARYNYTNRSSTYLGYGLELSNFAEAPGFVLPFELTLTRTRVGVPVWGPPVEADLDGEGMSLVACILSRRERIPAYQANGVVGAGGSENVEPTIGQVFP